MSEGAGIPYPITIKCPFYLFRPGDYFQSAQVIFDKDAITVQRKSAVAYLPVYKGEDGEEIDPNIHPAGAESFAVFKNTDPTGKVKWELERKFVYNLTYGSPRDGTPPAETNNGLVEIDRGIFARWIISRYFERIREFQFDERGLDRPLDEQCGYRNEALTYENPGKLGDDKSVLFQGELKGLEDKDFRRPITLKTVHDLTITDYGFILMALKQALETGKLPRTKVMEIRQQLEPVIDRLKMRQALQNLKQYSQEPGKFYDYQEVKGDNLLETFGGKSLAR